MAPQNDSQAGTSVRPTSDISSDMDPAPRETTVAAEPVVEKKESNSATHMSGWPLGLLLFGLFLVILIVTLDISIVAVAVPRITDEFQTIKDIGWYPAAFLITQCTLLPLAGRIYTFFPFKVCFLAFLAVFELGSLLCGVAQSSMMLIIGRAVCGIGGSGLINGALAIVGIAASPEKRPLMMGLFMAVSSCGQIVGPLIGGALTEHVSWRWCFYINLPVGGVTTIIFLFIRFPPSDKKTWTSKSLFWDLDLPGFAVFAPACVMLLLSITWGDTEYPWKSATIIGLLCGSVGMFAVFILWEIRQGEQAMIPPPIMKLRAVYSSCITACFQGGSMLILTYYLVLWFQIIKDASPAQSGVYTLPSFLGQVLFSVLTGIAMMKIRYALAPLVLGNVLTIVSYGMFSTFNPSTGSADWIGWQVMAGSGRGMALQIPLLVVQGAISKADLATGTSVIVWAQFLGGSIILTVAQSVFVSFLRAALRRYVPTLDASAAIEAGATNFIASVPPELHAAVLAAYNRAITHVFYLGVAVSGIALLTSFGIGTVTVQAGGALKAGKTDAAVAETGGKTETVKAEPEKA